MADDLLFKIEVSGIDKDLTELARLRGELMQNAAAQNELNKGLKSGKIDMDEYAKQTAKLSNEKQGLKTSADALNRTIQQQQQQFKLAEGSMAQISIELAQMRERYRNLSQAERENADVGGKLLTQIQAHDTQIKKLDATIGNHQRNVGNYRSGWEGVLGMFSGNIPVFGELEHAVGGVNAALGSSAKGMMLLGGAIGIAMASFGGLMDLMKTGINNALEEERAEIRLTYAMNGNIEAVERMKRFREQLMQTTLFSKDEINAAVNMGLEMGRTEGETRKMVEAAMGLSRVTGKDLNTMMLALSGTYEGQISRLGRLAGEVKNLSEEQLKGGAAVDVLNAKFGKFAHEGLNSTQGEIIQLKKSWDETLEDLGFKALTAFQYIKSYFQVQSAMSGGTDYSAGSKNMGRTNQELRDNITLLKERNAEGAKSTYWNDPKKVADDNEKLLKIYEDQRKKAEQTRKDNEQNAKKLFDNIQANNDYLVELTRKSIDDQIAAMVDGREKEKAMAQDKYEDSVIEVNRERRDRLKAIDDVIKDTKATGDQLKTLENQKAQIKEAANKKIESLQVAHEAALRDIDAKYNNTDKDKKIQDEYAINVAMAEEEGRVKLDVLRQYYASKGTLTKEQLKQQKEDEIKVALDVAQKKYDLLFAEIEARKKLGTITEEEYNKQLTEIANLYSEVKRLNGDQKALSDGDKKKPDAITSGIMTMFDIPEDQANKVKQKAGELMNSLKDLWLTSQQERIQAELRAETKKVDATYKKELASLDERRKKGLMTEKQYTAAKERLDEETEKKKDKLNREAFEKEKKVKRMNAIINTALAVTSALSMQPFVVGLIMAVLAAAMGAVEISKINSSKYEGAKGGLLRGPSHRNGGIKYAWGGDIVELEGGEGVINKQSMGSSDVLTMTGTPRQIASGINSYRGYGVPFDAGGYMPVSTPTRRASLSSSDIVSEAVDNRLRDMRVILVESDVTETQGRVKKVKTEATW